MIVTSESIKLNPYSDLSYENDGSTETKFGFKIGMEKRGETKIIIFDKEFIIKDVTDIEFLPFINIICQININEKYWGELKKQFASIEDHHSYGPSIHDIFWEADFDWINDNHKRWFRGEKIVDVLALDSKESD